ncbi:hypothetical protein AMS68_007564 [Peltaster fructicola]|uniref:HIG1 domain-containing protein n=1 Tax=Peltaster fructicola TaxID=286661 RepID=A0A6H0Y4T5_9PEZI|nr:hypothetical protein AMS68_007564 [Peltaster fructicola]
MKILTKEEEQQHYNATIQGGLIGGISGLAAGGLGVFAAGRRYPAFKGLGIPLQAFLVCSAGTFGSIISADRYSRHFERNRDPSSQYEDKSRAVRDQIDAQRSTTQKVTAWASENRYSIVFGSWVASIAGALGIIGRDKYLSTAQKLVQARVWAQGLTIAVVIASLAFETTDGAAGTGRWETVKILDPNDPTHQRLIEKKVHHERYAGEDQWRDMVEAEEQRLKERDQWVQQREQDDKKSGKTKKVGKHDDESAERGSVESSKDSKLKAP